MKKVLIGGAWPYANGSLHIGHLASLLPGDVLARYHRAIGNDVYYVSGSDCYGEKMLCIITSMVRIIFLSTRLFCRLYSWHMAGAIISPTVLFPVSI
jgi:methionyl-tRNA synthetase